MSNFFIYIILLSFNFNAAYGQINDSELEKMSPKELSSLFYENENNIKYQLKILKIYMPKAKKDKKKPINVAVGYYMYSRLYKDERSINYLDYAIKYSKHLNDEYLPLGAYREKAYKLRQLYRYEEAIQNYILAENLAKKTNLDFYYKIKLDIAELKSEELLQVDEALVLYRESLKYYEKKNIRNKDDFFYCYNQALFDMADAHKALKNIDSATYYNKRGFENSSLTNDNYYKYLFILNEGANLILRKRYLPAIDSINKALPKMIEFKNKANIIAGYYYLGHAYRGLGNKDKAIHNFKLLDSTYQEDKIIYPEAIDGYKYLIDYFRNTGNEEMELKYVNSLMAIDSFLYKRHRNIDKVIRKKYEIPHLLEEKQNTIDNLKSKYSIALYGVAFFILAILGLFWYNRHQKRVYKKRFDTLMLNLNGQIEAVENNEVNNNTPTKEIVIADALIASILNKLEQFEKKKQYLDKTINIQLLADQFETNSKYLSKIINDHKQMGFVQYINDFRIEYALKCLQSNPKLRKYTMIALADEFGFNTAESFSNAFFRRTGIKPSFYIKELENATL